MTKIIHRGPAVFAIMLASALAAAGLVRASVDPAKEHEKHRKATADTAKVVPAAGAREPAEGVAHEHQHGTPGATPTRPWADHTPGKTTTITGEVMDPACYLEAGPKSIGPRHYQCALDCARSGQTIALYDRQNDRIYFLAGEFPDKNPNGPLLPYVHKRVDVYGTVYFRSGVYGIVILSVTPHPDAPGGTTPATGGKGAGK